MLGNEETCQENECNENENANCTYKVVATVKLEEVVVSDLIGQRGVKNGRKEFM